MTATLRQLNSRRPTATWIMTDCPEISYTKESAHPSGRMKAAADSARPRGGPMLDTCGMSFYNAARLAAPPAGVNAK